MASGALRDYFGRGPIASRPAAPDLYGDVLGFWFATDTGVLSAWNGVGWEDVGSVDPIIAAPPSGGWSDGALLIYSISLGAWVEIPPGTPGQVLTQQSGPVADWEDPAGGGAVSSVNGQTGAVVLSLFDLPDVLPNTGAPDDGDVLTWSAAQNAWMAQPGGSGSGTDLGWFNVKAAAYGATGDGTTDDTTAIAAAVTALNAAGGGVLFFPPGTYKTSGGFTFTTKASVVGSGRSGSSLTSVVTAISTVTCTSTTAHLFTFAASSGSVQDIHLSDAVVGTRTAGAAIRVTAGNGMRYHDFSTFGFYNAVQVEDGFEWQMERGFIYGPINYGLYLRNIALPDGGDAAISDMHIVSVDRNAAAAIRIQSGGGVKISNLKINERGGNTFTHGIDISVDSASSTSILMLTNVSCEGIPGSALKARAAAGAVWHLININGMQARRASATSTAPLIDIVGNSGEGNFNHLIINGFAAYKDGSDSHAAINLSFVDNAVIGPCINANGYNPFLTTTTCTNLRNLNADVSETFYIAAPAATTYPLILNATRGGIVRSITTKTGTGTATVQGKIDGTNLGGTANSASTTESTQTHSSANTFIAGQDVEVTLSSLSSCAGLSITVSYTPQF